MERGTTKTSGCIRAADDGRKEKTDAMEKGDDEEEREREAEEREKRQRRTVTSSPPLDQTRSSEAAQCGVGVFRCRGGSAMVKRGDWKSGGRAS